MFRLTVSLLFGFGTLLAFASGGFAGTIIFSDFSPGQTFTLDAIESAGSGRVVSGAAASFFPVENDPAYSFTSPSNSSVSQIDVGLFLGDGSVTASLWTAAPGCGTGVFASLCGGLVPTTELGSWDITSSSPASGATVIGITGVDLTAGSMYFLQLTADTATSYGLWANNLLGVTSSLWQCGGDNPCAGDAPIGIASTGTFDVVGTPNAVPEPTGASLLAIGLGGLGAFARKRGVHQRLCQRPAHSHGSVPQEGH